MNIIQTVIPEVLIVEPKIFGDSRGFFFELYQCERYAASGIPSRFVQDNLSRSSKGRSARPAYPEPQSAGQAGYRLARFRARCRSGRA